MYLDLGVFPYARSGAAMASWNGTVLVDKADATGTYYRRNRSYDPATARFTQEDPIGLAGGMNAYGFASGDPVNYADPFGLWPSSLQRVSDLFSRAVRVYERWNEEAKTKQAARDAELDALMKAPLGTSASIRNLTIGAVLGVEGSGEQIVERKALGADGGKSVHVLEKVGGRTNSITHRVELDGDIIHQHQTHIGKYGGERRFPDEWTGTQTIDRPKQ